MRRGDSTVLSVTVVLTAVAVAAVAFSLLVLDRKPRPPHGAAQSDSSLLVLTWAPSLCQVEPSNAGCKSGHVGRMGKSFVLHGLWPQPSSEQYCDVPKRTPDKSRAPVALPGDVEQSLQTMMSDSTVMTTHEWYAHGTCSGVTPPEYFGLATSLAKQATEVLGPLFAQAPGGEVSSRSVRDAVEARFGKGTGGRVSLSCRDAARAGSIMYEVRLSLPPVMALQAGRQALGDALAGGPAVPPGCGKARVP